MYIIKESYAGLPVGKQVYPPSQKDAQALIDRGLIEWVEPLAEETKETSKKKK